MKAASDFAPVTNQSHSALSFLGCPAPVSSSGLSVFQSSLVCVSVHSFNPILGREARLCQYNQLSDQIIRRIGLVDRL
jgi:hypothetical protein